jgi:LysM repeat protein
MRASLSSFFILSTIFLATAREKITTVEYIETYKSVAIQEMNMYGIPASITLAQGILESGSGNSHLAIEANNHFGIKCHRDWEGRKVYHDDDEKNECFRAYKDPNESFRDHSLFLKDRSRYAFLFEEDRTDYKAWAKGLKKAGYATNPKYPKLLINLIETHNLHQYDLKQSEEEDYFELDLSSAIIQTSSNKVKFIVAGEGDSFESIASQTENKPADLLEYNELNYDDKLKAGDKVYLQPKKRKAARSFKTHTVAPGETMYFIAQKYAVKLKYLYKRNELKIGYQPKAGEILELR